MNDGERDVAHRGLACGPPHRHLRRRGPVDGYDDSVMCDPIGHFASLPDSDGRPSMTLDPGGRAERRRWSPTRVAKRPFTA